MSVTCFCVGKTFNMIGEVQYVLEEYTGARGEINEDNLRRGIVNGSLDVRNLYLAKNGEIQLVENCKDASIMYENTHIERRDINTLFGGVGKQKFQSLRDKVTKSIMLGAYCSEKEIDEDVYLIEYRDNVCLVTPKSKLVVMDCYGQFRGFWGNVTLVNVDVSKCSEFSQMFKFCEIERLDLSKVHFPNIDTNKYRMKPISYEEMFAESIFDRLYLHELPLNCGDIYGYFREADIGTLLIDRLEVNNKHNLNIIFEGITNLDVLGIKEVQGIGIDELKILKDKFNIGHIKLMSHKITL